MRIAGASGLVLAAAIIAGCNGSDNNNGGPTPASTATPGTAATPGTTATPRPGATATPRPGATATPRPGATATPLATARPTATAIPALATFTTISTSGTFSSATGRFSQTSGTFQQVRGRPQPGATPVPTVAPTQAGGTPTVVVYRGTFTLNSGTRGAFLLSVLPDGSADGVGTPPEVVRFQMDPVPVANGTATVSLQISGSTGSGSIRLSNGDSGAIAITSRTGIVARSIGNR